MTRCPGGLAGGALIALALALAAPARADEPGSTEHAIGIYTRTNAAFVLTAARTAGGVGGGLGLRDTIDDWLRLQLDLGYLFGVGNLGELRVGGGLQLPGEDRTYQPAATFLLALYFGDQLKFLSEDHPTGVWDPAVVPSIELSPLRFTTATATVSLLAPAVGMALDVPTVGPAFQVTALEVELLLP